MAVFNEPTQWTHTLGNAADVSTLPDDTGASTGLASLQKLWQQVNQLPLSAGGVAPARTDFNALFKLLGDSVFYAMQGGIASYNAGYDYPIGALVKYNNVLYFCIQANGANSTVVTPPNNAYWLQLASTDPWAQFPTGFVALWNSKNAFPNNWLVMNGQSVPKSAFVALNNFINSDGSLNDPNDSSKLVIPDLRAKVWQGTSDYSAILASVPAGLPNITGSTGRGFQAITGGTAAGALSLANRTNKSYDQVGTYDADEIFFNASTSNAIYGSSGTVQPPAVKTMFIIKA